MYCVDENHSVYNYVKTLTLSQIGFSLCRPMVAKPHSEYFFNCSNYISITRRFSTKIEKMRSTLFLVVLFVAIVAVHGDSILVGDATESQHQKCKKLEI